MDLGPPRVQSPICQGRGQRALGDTPPTSSATIAADFGVGNSSFVVKGSSVGIHRSSPNTALEISSGGVIATGASGYIASMGSVTAAGFFGKGATILGNVGVNTTSPNALVEVSSGGLVVTGGTGGPAGYITSMGSVTASGLFSNGAIIMGNVGIGTTNPQKNLEVAGNGFSVGTSTFVVTGSSVGITLGANVTPAYKLHLSSGSLYLDGAFAKIETGATTAPALSACGTGTIFGSDIAGEVTMTGAASCTVTFTSAYALAPICVVSDKTTLGGTKVSAISATALTLAATSGDVVDYICLGRH